MERLALSLIALPWLLGADGLPAMKSSLASRYSLGRQPTACPPSLRRFSTGISGSKVRAHFVNDGNIRMGNWPIRIKTASRSSCRGVAPAASSGPLVRPTLTRSKLLDSGDIYKIAKEESPKSQEKWFEAWEALLKYRELHGNLVVPHRYVVPEGDEEWPAHLHGFKLGQKVRNIRAVGLHVKSHPSRIEMLNEIGFIWDDNEFRFRQTMKSLQAYLKVYGELSVPVEFVVPAEDPWDPICWGVPLGVRVHNIRAHDLHIKNYPNRKSMLDEIGFIWDDDVHRFRQLVKALEVYRSIYGNLLVRQNFVVPNDDARWPRSVWGLPLGDRTRSLRTSKIWIKDNPRRKQELERIGFVFNPRQIEAEKLVAYIAHFKSLHGHCNVPRGFTAASSDSAWEDIMAQFGQKDVVRLGQKVHRLRGQRRNMSREMKQKLQDLGFSWSLRDSIFNDTLLALKIYNDMYGSSKVQRSFVVPHDSDDRWPEALRGFALGEKLHKVKYLGTFIKNRPDRQLRLEELGFDIPPRFAVVARDQGDRQAGHNRVVLNENEEN